MMNPPLQPVTFDPVAVAAVESFLFPRGIDAPAMLWHSSHFARFDHTALRIACARNARYGIVTNELVEFLEEEIKGQKQTIEIGSGMGDLAWRMSIVGTDSYIQTDPAMALYYASLGQPTITPPPHIAKVDALTAIEMYRPTCVIGMWVTQLFDPKIHIEGQAQAFVNGIDEREILKRVDKYIMIGNEAVHGEKLILSEPHRTVKAPWIMSRAADPSKNVIWIWEK